MANALASVAVGRRTRRLVIAIEDRAGQHGKGIARIRLKRIPDASGESLVGFIRTHVSSGAHIRTDGWSGYESLNEEGYKHIVVGSKELNIAHLVAALLKRWLLGTYQGADKANSIRLLLGRIHISLQPP